jgi:predicted DNA-binding transcriptional regulator AlpA
MSLKAAINFQSIFVTYPQLPAYGVPSYSRVHLMRMMRRGQFPQQVQLSPNRVAWRVTDILEWVANRPLSQKACPAPEPPPRPPPPNARPEEDASEEGGPEDDKAADQAEAVVASRDKRHRPHRHPAAPMACD